MNQREEAEQDAEREGTVVDLNLESITAQIDAGERSAITKLMEEIRGPVSSVLLTAMSFASLPSAAYSQDDSPQDPVPAVRSFDNPEYLSHLDVGIEPEAMLIERTPLYNLQALSSYSSFQYHSPYSLGANHGGIHLLHQYGDQAQSQRSFDRGVAISMIFKDMDYGGKGVTVYLANLAMKKFYAEVKPGQKISVDFGFSGLSTQELSTARALRQALNTLHYDYLTNGEGQEFSEFARDNLGRIVESIEGFKGAPATASTNLVLSAMDMIDTANDLSSRWLVEGALGSGVAKDLTGRSVNPIEIERFEMLDRLLAADDKAAGIFAETVKYDFPGKSMVEIGQDFPGTVGIYNDVKELKEGQKGSLLGKQCADLNQRFNEVTERVGTLADEIEQLREENAITQLAVLRMEKHFKDQFKKQQSDNDTYNDLLLNRNIGQACISVLGALGPRTPEFKVAIAATSAAIDIAFASECIGKNVAAGGATGTVPGVIAGFVIACVQIYEADKAAKAEAKFKRNLMKSIHELRKELRVYFKELNRQVHNGNVTLIRALGDHSYSMNQQFGQMFFELDKLQAYVAASDAITHSELGRVVGLQRETLDALIANRMINILQMRELIVREEIDAILGLSASSRLLSPEPLPEHILRDIEDTELSYPQYLDNMNVFLVNQHSSRGSIFSAGGLHDVERELTHELYERSLRQGDIAALISYLERLGLHTGSDSDFENRLKAMGADKGYSFEGHQSHFNQPANIQVWSRNTLQFLEFAKRAESESSPNFEIYEDYYYRYDYDLKKLSHMIVEGYRLREQLTQLLPANEQGQLLSYKIDPLFSNHERLTEYAVETLNTNKPRLDLSKWSKASYFAASDGGILQQRLPLELQRSVLKSLSTGIRADSSYQAIQDKELVALPTLSVHDHEAFVQLIPEHILKACYLFDGKINLSYRDVENSSGTMQLTIEGHLNLGSRGVFPIFEYETQLNEHEAGKRFAVDVKEVSSEILQLWNNSDHCEKDFLDGVGTSGNLVSEEVIDAGEEALNKLMNEFLEEAREELKNTAGSGVYKSLEALQQLEASRLAIIETLALFTDDVAINAALEKLASKRVLIESYMNKGGKVALVDFSNSTGEVINELYSSELPSKRNMIAMIDTVLFIAERVYAEKFVLHQQIAQEDGMEFPLSKPLDFSRLLPAEVFSQIAAMQSVMSDE